MTEEGYFINQELMEEMVRLNRQAHLVTREMLGALPEPLPVAAWQDVLDLACGPGEWVMQMARAYPHLRQVIGVDKSRRMIAYANAQAEAEEEQRVSFRVMDVTQPLDFPDNSFDLVNGRFLLSFMRREQWPLLLAECVRILRTGGVLRITEQESGYTNDPYLQRYIDVWGEAWRKAGHAFALTHAYVGLTVVLKLMMREAGLVNPAHRPISIDLSTGQPAHQPLLENLAEALRLAEPFLLKTGVIEQKDIAKLHAQMESLVGKANFCAYWLLQTVWAFKPE